MIKNKLYYQGAFLIAGDSVKSILVGDYNLICHKIRSDYTGNILDEIKSKKSLSHKRLRYKSSFMKAVIEMSWYTQAVKMSVTMSEISMYIASKLTRRVLNFTAKRISLWQRKQTAVL